MAELVVHVPDIDEAGKDYSFQLSPAQQDALLAEAGLRADPQFGSGEVTVHVQLNGTEYLVTGRVQAHLLTECSRCLGDAPVPVDTELAALFARGEASGSGRDAGGHGHSKHPEVEEFDDADLDGEDMQRETFAGSDIVLDGLVREHMVLEQPMQPLCSEQCPGIAIPQHVRPPDDVFGKDAVDPRLAPLQRLRDNVPVASEGPTLGDETPASRESSFAKKPKTSKTKSKKK